MPKILLKSQTNLSKQLLIANKTLNLEQFIEEELEGVVKNESRKAAGFDEIYPEVWKTRKFDNFFFSNYAMLSINKTQLRNEQKVDSSPSLTKVT